MIAELNDIDFDEEGVDFTIITEPNHGEATSVPITPPHNYILYELDGSGFIGEDSIVYELCKIDSDVYCDTATIYINILSSNFNPPVAVDDTITVLAEISTDIDVLENDFDGDGNDLIITELFSLGTEGDIFITGSNMVNYTPTALGIDDFGYVVCDNGTPSFCDTATVHVIISSTPVDGPVLDVPNSFSPNNDGINDVLEIEGLENYSGFQLKIFNRWSSLIYETTDVDKLWNGKSNVEFMSSSGDVPEGTYYYILYLDGVIDPLTGFIVVKR